MRTTASHLSVSSDRFEATVSARWLRAKELLHGAIGFLDRVAVVHCTGKVGIRKSDSTVGAVAQDVARRGLAVDAKEEAGLRIHVGVAPAVEYDAGDVAARIEAAGREHVGELLPEPALVLRERGPEQLRASSAALFAYGKAGLCEQHLDSQHCR